MVDRINNGTMRTYFVDNVLAPLRRSPLELQWAWLTVLFGVIALALGIASGLLVPSWPPWWEYLLMPALLIFYPSLLEESIFRGLLLPDQLRTADARTQLLAVVTSTVLFVAMHPLNHWFVGLSGTSDFTNPYFLIIVSLLGLTCAVQRLRTDSLWLPILTHWFTVLAWNLFLGRNLEM